MATQHFHAAIWIDHHEAKVFHFNATEAERHTLDPNSPAMHIHHKTIQLEAGMKSWILLFYMVLPKQLQMQVPCSFWVQGVRRWN
jgi:hypothetical protein